MLELSAGTARPVTGHSSRSGTIPVLGLSAATRRLSAVPVVGTGGKDHFQGTVLLICGRAVQLRTELRQLLEHAGELLERLSILLLLQSLLQLCRS